MESVEIKNNVVVINCPTPVTTIEHNKPYIIKWNGGEDIVNPVFNAVTVKSSYPEYITMYITDGISTYTMYFDGFTYDAYTCGEDYTWCFITNGSSVLEPMLTGYIIKAFSCYFYHNTSPDYIDGMILNTGEEDDLITGLDALNGETGNEVIYNIAGQRLAKKQKGINIVNGKKVLIK